MTRYVHVEHLLGRRVRDAQGRVIGRILAIHAVIDGPHCRITEYHLGTAALLGRLGIRTAHLIGLPLRHEPKKLRWDELDLSDPERPKLAAE